MDFVRSTLQTITACCLNCRDEETAAGEPTERTPLFVEQQRRIVNENETRNIRISEDDIGEYSSSLPKLRDEQTALNRIVQETNS